MRVFLSWSGEKARRAAELLQQLLPDVIQCLDPWFSDHNIEPGAPWDSKIESGLENAEYAIVLVTGSNQHSQWLMYEVGAMAVKIKRIHVCPVLLDLKNTDLRGPLTRFQSVDGSRDSIYKILVALNDLLEKKLDPSRLERAFSAAWEGVSDQWKEILELDQSAPTRSTNDMIPEILQIVRSLRQEVPESAETRRRKMQQALATFSGKLMAMEQRRERLTYAWCHAVSGDRQAMSEEMAALDAGIAEEKRRLASINPEQTVELG